MENEASERCTGRKSQVWEEEKKSGREWEGKERKRKEEKKERRKDGERENRLFYKFSTKFCTLW